MNYKQKKILSAVLQVVVIVIAISLIFAGIQAVRSLFEIRDGYYEAKLDYHLGSLTSDSTGKGVIEENDSMIYSDALICTGLRIMPSMSPRYQVQIHFYTEDNRYIGYKVFADQFYELKVGEMPYLKDVVGNIEGSDYQNASLVKEDGKALQAHHVRFVINPLDTQEDLFTCGWFGLAGLANQRTFIDSLCIQYTDAAVAEDATQGPAVSI